MARKPSKPIDANDERLKLIEALKFAAIASANNDGVASYVSITNGFVSAFNDTFTIGCPIGVSLDLCPQADKFQAALVQCGQHFQLTQVSLNGVSIKSGNFRALVPAISHDLLAPAVPDPPCASIDDKLKDAFIACNKLITKGDRVINQCLLMRSGSVVATNGGIALEYWHGIDLPQLLIPKKTVDVIAKIAKPLKQFGLSAASATFYFEDGSFLKSRLISGEYPNVDNLYASIPNNFVPIWKDFYVGLDAVSKFVDGDTIVLHPDHIGTHAQLQLGASYKVAGLPGTFGFSPAYWKALEPYITHVCVAERRSAPFAAYGPNVRALIMGKNI